ncbi:hypothetical protein VFPPC_03353 [Pochonia chlamydosporia 170]|uniref:Uncharacterized protein n=1 Tax=Pochonia chlamydosporia 170 TaxID=1380566 RepID=A0A179FZD3_METCM|nr:hypothetical protein VFPPC_03353 [Pochonia chlamydosporia 170]OAQ70972.1 hypothetical protein VFPPC_03353 [Pochonia chlamydosporia 170]
MRGQFLLLISFLLTPWFTYDPIDYYQRPVMEFCPERAAQLHNQLLQKAISHDASIATERTLLDRFLQVADVDSEFQQHPLGQFLSLLDSTPQSGSRLPGLFTPRLYQPDPSYFWDDTYELHPNHVLLYGQNNADCPMDGGIYLNLYTARVIWRMSPNDFPEIEESLHVPLEVFHKMLLRNWESGKYYYDNEEKEISVRWWQVEDLEEALSSWDKLLSAIERRLPQTTKKRPERMPPLDSELLKRFKLGKFAREWLSLATRPGFRYIAPGLTTFSPESFTEIYGAESASSYWQNVKLLSEEFTSSLLFPADIIIPTNISTTSTDRDITSFDKDWGFGKFTVARRAGIYTDPLNCDHADTVRLMHPSGLVNLVELTTNCPWDWGRLPRLAEVLEKWTSLIETGAWEIDGNGVKTGIEWFRTHTLESKLDWQDIIEEEIAKL